MGTDPEEILNCALNTVLVPVLQNSAVENAHKAAPLSDFFIFRIGLAEQSQK